MVLVVFAGLAGGSYYLWRLYGEDLKEQFFPNSSRETERVSVEQTPPAVGKTGLIEADIQALLDREAAEREVLAERLSGQLAAMQLELNRVDQRLRQLSTTSREDWLLAEAEYLLRLANQRLLTERQGANALSLMESADAILRDLDDVELFPVRKALAGDITRLRMAATVDREGIYLRLGALVEAVDNLATPLPAVGAKQAEAAPAGESSVPAKSWSQQLWANTREALASLKGLVALSAATCRSKRPCPWRRNNSCAMTSRLYWSRPSWPC